VLSILRHLSVRPSDLRGIGIQVTRLESDNVGNKFLDSFLIRGTRGSQQVGSSDAPQEESYSQSTVQDTNKHSTDTVQQADSSIIVKQAVCTRESGLAAKAHSHLMAHELCDLDEEVLAALPEDIRQEVLQTYQPSSTSRVQRDAVVTKLKSPTTEQVPSVHFD